MEDLVIECNIIELEVQKSLLNLLLIKCLNTLLILLYIILIEDNVNEIYNEYIGIPIEMWSFYSFKVLCFWGLMVFKS